MIFDRRKRFLLFGLYSFAENLFFLVLELLPRFVRNIIFKGIFASFGKDNLIDYRTYFRYPWKISIGSNVSINRGVTIYASHAVPSARIIIKDNVAIGPQVKIFSASHNIEGLGLDDTAETIVINEYSWIGGASIILPGVSIGRGAIIGSGSVVTSSVPDNAVAVGNPAKVIKMRAVEDSHD